MPGWRASCKQIGRGFRLSLSLHTKYIIFAIYLVVYRTVSSCCICSGYTKNSSKI
nr:MAG TPA: hypothetical protein [Ackermannviridae sp.]